MLMKMKPLSKDFREALNLNDDAAILNNFKDKNFVISVDNFITGVHCPNWLNASYSITRAILVAVSDISAMAAKPYCIFLSISMPKKIKKNLFDDLQKGINKALFLTDMKLAGGDLCVYDGPLSFCVTVVGKAKKNNILKRAGARIEDYLCVTGTIGDSKIGLDSLLKQRKFDHILLTMKPHNHVFEDCIGKEFKKSENYIGATRNPFNRNTKYDLLIYQFNYEMLPGCFKR